MWHSSLDLSLPSALQAPIKINQENDKAAGQQSHKKASGLLGRLSFVTLSAMTLLVQGVAVQTVVAQTAVAQTAVAQADVPAPTARYAQGEDVDLADIVAEWRGYYEDVPVYQCVCIDDTCSQTEQWPYRQFDRYQLSVALGPNTAKATESNGFNCFDIADGSRPSDPRAFSAALRDSAQTDTNTAAGPAPGATDQPRIRPRPRPSTPSISQPPISQSPRVTQPPSVTQTPSSRDVVTATVINDGTDIQLDWPSGSSNVVSVTGSSWNINVLDALDCESLSVVAQKMMVAQRVQGAPVVDETTGHVAVPVLLDSCVDVDQMAVFVLDPAEGGGYALYRTQLPPVQGALSQGTFSFPNEFSSYAYSTVVSMQYWDGSLLVRQGSASGAEAISIFRMGPTPAGTYAGCGVVNNLEGATALCEE